MADSQTKNEVPQRTYFYYPAFDEKYARRVLAGIVSGNKIYVGEAQCFTGNKEKPEPDQFNKSRGRVIAEGRAWKGVHFVPGEGRVNPAVLIIDIPSGTTAIGKLFVQEVEKVYPKHVGKVKKAKGEPAPEQQA